MARYDYALFAVRRFERSGGVSEIPGEVLGCGRGNAAFKHGKSVLVRLGEEEVWRTDLEPGWNWDENLEPYAEGATSCPLTHRELVISGTIRYREVGVFFDSPVPAAEAP